MEFGTIEREIYVEASPEIVFDVVSSPDHLKQWWPDDARYEPTPGSEGEIVFGDRVGRRDAAQDDRDGLPRDGLGGRGPGAAVPGARHRLGLLPAAAGAVRRDAAGAAMSAAV